MIRTNCVPQIERFCKMLDESLHIRGYSHAVENGDQCIIVDAMNEETEDCATVKIFFNTSGDIKEFVVVP